MAYVPMEAAEEGSEIFVEIRNRRAAARVVPLPFYSRRKA
jgi:glycine cleavage system aminomethyltransferase T